MAWADYFGRESVGTIRGVLTPLTAGSVAAGPILVGLGYDITGDYFMPYAGLLAQFLTGAVVIMVARPPVKAEVATPTPAA